MIAQSVGIGRTAIGEYIRRAAVIGITWPVPEELDDAALERKLFAPAGYNPLRSKPPPELGAHPRGAAPPRRDTGAAVRRIPRPSSSRPSPKPGSASYCPAGSAPIDALTFLDGVPMALVCDNLKTGVTAASRYEPGGASGPTRIPPPITARPLWRRHTTIPEHVPSAHRRQAYWTPVRLLASAE